MIKSILASNVSKLVASCVCPVAGTVALTVGVPPVRNAVHRATAPRAYALPKTRVRQTPAAAVAAPVQTAQIVAPPCAPVMTASGPIAAFDTVALDGTPRGLPDVRDFTSVPTRVGDQGVDGIAGVVLPGVPGVPGVPVAPGVPEPATWLHMLVGFGVIGGIARYSLRHASSAEPEEA